MDDGRPRTRGRRGAGGDGPRPYTLRQRAELQAQTRQRLVEAAIALHEELGPARTTISAIAERAGVQRLTVYRHFPDEESLLQACSSTWGARHAPPDPQAWQGIADPHARTLAALGALYAWYRRHERMLTSVYRDAPEMAAVRKALAAGPGQYLDGVRDDLLRAWNPPARARAPVRAVLAHCLAFATWKSLKETSLADETIATLCATWIGAVAHGDAAPRSAIRHARAGRSRRMR